MVAKSLSVLYGSLIFNQKIDDSRQIFNDFPNQKMALFIHKLHHINYDVNLVRHNDNIFIDCTLVCEGRIEHDLYRRVLFYPEALLRYIWKLNRILLGHNYIIFYQIYRKKLRFNKIDLSLLNKSRYIWCIIKIL